MHTLVLLLLFFRVPINSRDILLCSVVSISWYSEFKNKIDFLFVCRVVFGHFYVLNNIGRISTENCSFMFESIKIVFEVKQKMTLIFFFKNVEALHHFESCSLISHLYAHEQKNRKHYYIGCQYFFVFKASNGR